ncbi:MAG TPA: BofC protein [Paenibacillaceae bacterium]|nr:BofC protein [Paenibacillaceae bacterium]
MMFYNQFRRPSNRVVLIASIFFLFLVAIISAGFFYYAVSGWKPSIGVRAVSGEMVHVILKKTYVTGEIEIEKKDEVIESTKQLLHRYEGWKLIHREDNEFTFEMRVNDLSPTCKANGYFGINEKGELSLFDGVPEKEKVIQTFFQINTKKIESHLPKEELSMLKRGIRVQDVDEYNSILSTFSEFANSEKASTIKVE